MLGSGLELTGGVERLLRSCGNNSPDRRRGRACFRRGMDGEPQLSRIPKFTWPMSGLAGWSLVGGNRMDFISLMLSNAFSSSSGVPCRATSGVGNSARMISRVGVDANDDGLGSVDTGLGSDDDSPRTCRHSAAFISPGNSSWAICTSPRYMKCTRVDNS